MPIPAEFVLPWPTGLRQLMEQTGVRGFSIQSAPGLHCRWGRGASGLDKQVTQVSRALSYLSRAPRLQELDSFREEQHQHFVR